MVYLKLHLNQIRHISSSKVLKATFMLLFCVFLPFSVLNAQVQSEGDLKKQAEKYFEEEEYGQAYKLYSQLVSLYPKDPEYNYKLGVCMLYSEPDKKKPFSYLQIATANAKDGPKEAKFYLAKTYHVNYKFDDAIKLYNEYKLIGSSANVKKLQVDREIEACRHGKRLLSNLSDLVVITKKQLNEADYFRSYDVKDIGGKLLVKPDDFKSGLDKKKKEKSVVYLPKSGERVYYSSYGDNGDKGRDIYFVNRLPNGSWSKPQAMPASINTEYDEDYPFLHPNGKTLYFSSKGHNSMGGYDIFKTTFNSETQTWSKPENLEFPINSPDDDILFVTDSLEKTAFFSTGRYSPYGKIDVLKVNTERRPMNFAVLKGTVVKEEAGQSLKSKITVKNMDNGEIVGTYQAKDNGDYYMELPNGGKLLFTVETPGIPTQSDAVQMPIAYSLKPYKQVISYDNKKLKIINYFDGQVADENYAMMIDLIEKKAKLEINEMDPYNQSLKDAAIKNNNNNNASNNLNAVNTNNPTIVNEANNNNNGQNNTNKNVTNDQLLSIAKMDSKEAQDEANKLKQEATDAFGLATQKTEEANLKQKEADAALVNANSISDVNKKNEEITKANELKEEANIASKIANTATNLANKLEIDATQKQKEADLNNQYIKQLEEIIKNKNNKEALAKLESIQKELDAINNQKNQSDELVNSIKAETELKEKELLKTENKSKEITNEINLLNNEVKSLENDLANETDKTLKENISSQIKELKNDIEIKNKDLSANNQKIETINNEVNALNQELAFTTKIINEESGASIANNNNNNNNNNTGNNSTGNKTNNNTANNNAVDSNTNSAITNNANAAKSNTSAVNNNATNTNSIAGVTNNNNNNNIANTNNSTPTNTTSINNNNLATNSNTYQNISSANNNDKGNGLNPINTTNQTELKTQLNSLQTNLNANKEITNNLTGNNYQEFTSTSTKQELTDKFNTVKQNEDELNNLINQIQNNNSLSTNSNPSSLLNEADELNNKASSLRKEAVTKTGNEKDVLIKQAVENEKLAITKKLTASDLQLIENKNIFENNNLNLTELQKLTGEKTSNEISQANLLIDEAKLNFKQAEKIKNEANNYPSESAKLGGYNNAEEKENEALLKQQKALDILSKINPGYALKTASKDNPNQNDLAKLNSQINKTTLSQVEAYTALNNANETEIKQQNNILTNNPSFANTTNNEVKKLKNESDNLNKEALTLIAQSNAAKSNSEKAELLLKANQKETEALQKIKTAITELNSSTIASNATNVTNNQSNVVNATNTNSTTTNDITTNNTVTNNSTQTNTLSVSNVSNEANNNNAVVQNNQSGDDPKNLKSGLNNAKENSLSSFNMYTNSEAVNLKKQASDKLIKALSEDNLISNEIDKLPANITSSNSSAINQENITSLQNEAEKLNNEAFTLRKTAGTKTVTEKDDLIAQAKKLESEATTKKVNAASMLKSLNEATYDANNQSIIDLAKMAQGKNISELNNAESLMNEINSAIKQAKNLRQEADNLPNDAAKLGGYNNAEEKEAWLIEKQYNLLAIYKKYFSNYVLKEPNLPNSGGSDNPQLQNVKNKISTNNSLHIEGLTTLSQANEKEYKSRFLSLPTNLNTSQNKLKSEAQNSYKKVNDLIAKANQTTDLNAKKSLLIEANENGQKAIDLLNQITQNNSVIAGNNNNSNTPTNNTNNQNSNNTSSITATNNNVVASNTNNNASNSNNTTAGNNVNNSTNSNSIKLKVEGLEVKTNNAYSNTKPIPIDEKIPDGLVFKVQIGAFKAPLPNNTFKGLSPVIGQTTPSGYIRYMAGNFEKYESANAVKNDLRNLGYGDAFVVAYYNGQRINLNEATEKAKAAGQIITVAANTSAGITANSNVPKNTITPTANINQNQVDTQPVEITKELEQMNGLLYTVQIGVFSKQVTRSQLYNLKPIYTEKLPNGLYRYTAGIYNQSTKLLEDKRKVVDLGVKDAFVSAYYNAKRIPFAEGQKIQTESNNLKMETENPIIFSGAVNTSLLNNTNPATNNPTTNTSAANPTVTPFTNNVTNEPIPTAENGVKTDDSGVSFKVQIGAYVNQVPNDIAAKFSNIKTWPIKNTVINGLYIYTIGNFNAVNFAKKLRDEAVSLGINDAFITVYKDGKKLYGAAANEYLSK